MAKKKDKDYVIEHWGKVPVSQIASFLGREEEEIESMAADAGLYTNDGGKRRSRRTIITGLRESPFWGQIQAQFSDAELKFYVQQYADLVLQFGDDVLASERIQIHRTVCYEILLNRNLAEQKRLETLVGELRSEVTNLHNSTTIAKADKARIELLNIQIGETKKDLAARVREFADLDAKHQGLMEDMKATRNQRLDKISSNKHSFLDLIKLLMVDEKGDEQGRKAELIKQATLRKMAELGKPHQYADGSWDKPLLSPDTV